MWIERGPIIEATTGRAYVYRIRYIYPDDVDEPLDLAQRHFEHNRATGARHYGEAFVPPERVLENNRLSMVTEFLGAWLFKLPFKRTLGSARKGPDLEVLDVRVRRIEKDRPEPDLPLRPDDPPNLPQVLFRMVSVAAGFADVIGWLTPWQARERDNNQWCQLKGVYYVKPPYHSVRSLRQLLACGCIKQLWVPPPGSPRTHPFA